MSAVAALPVFTVNWISSDVALLHTESGRKIGELFWNGAEWFFIRVDPSGEQVMDGFHYIDVDPESHRVFRDQRMSIAAEDESIREALHQELKGRLELHRDETRDLAIVGAHIEVRRWWPQFEALVKGCTGVPQPDGTWQHDGDSCPVHEP